MRESLRAVLERGLLFDSSIVAHGFTPYLRDYDLLVDVVGTTSADVGHGYIAGRYRFRFTHCPHALVTTAVRDDVWRASWDDLYTDYAAWEAAGQPSGYVWGVNYSAAYPGATLVRESALAAEWSERVGRAMHEVRIETNGHAFQIVFHRLLVARVASGSPEMSAPVLLGVEEWIYAGPDA